MDQRAVADVAVADDPAHVRGAPPDLAGVDAVEVLHRPRERDGIAADIALHAQDVEDRVVVSTDRQRGVVDGGEVSQRGAPPDLARDLRRGQVGQELGGERLQLIDGGVTHHVAPHPIAPWPHHPGKVILITV